MPPSPIVTPHLMVTLFAIQTSLPITTFLAGANHVLCGKVLKISGCLHPNGNVVT